MNVVDVLAIAAHPDDVEITCAGLLIRMADQGYRTGVLDLTRGEMGTRGSAEIRDREAAAAAQIMGLAVRENACLPDSRLTLNDASREALAGWIRRLRPKVVIVPSQGQRHPDHNAAGEIAYAGIFAAGLQKFPVDGAAHRPDQVLYTVSGEQQTPSFYVDITAQLERKLQAVAAYESQFPKVQEGEDIYELMTAAARCCGSRCGVRYAESYCVKQPVLVDDPIRQLRLKAV